MDYVVGSIAELISGNVTPNRPKKSKKAQTPIKHQPSPNVTPKCEFVEDRSIFLSPTMQKKKAIKKKSPKRIFQNSDPDIFNDEDGDSKVLSPKADRVKKHLKDKLDFDSEVTNQKSNSKPEEHSPDKKVKKKNYIQNVVENIPKKKRKQQLSETEVTNEIESNIKDEKENFNTEITGSNLKKKKSKSMTEFCSNSPAFEGKEKPPKKNKKNKQKGINEDEDHSNTISTDNQTPKKKNKKNKKIDATESIACEDVNPNAVTSKDTDSEHDSDNEIDSDNEETNKAALTSELADHSSDEEAKEHIKKKTEVVQPKPNTNDEVLRTLFVGNVPFSSKCKKEIKKIFNQYGKIETVRIRTVPIKDPRDTPKMAIIKKELHPDRTTVNIYIKYADASSLNKALSANNMIFNGNHLRVSRSDTTGSVHDPKCSVFVGNMPFTIEDEVLREKFQRCGEIESVRIIRDKKTNAGKGFGYVNFASKDGVELALSLTEEDLTIKNRILRVKRCTQPTQKKFVNKDQFNKHGHQAKNELRGNFGNRQNDERNQGAYRRLMNKRNNQDNGDGPPSKRPNMNQPHKEKKPRKEFLGMTAEKKKKNKFSKDQKKKKVLSELLAKK